MSDDALEIEELLDLGEPLYNADEVSEAAGVDVEFADRLWLALGFAFIPRDEKAFTKSDRDALRTLAAFEEAGFADRPLILAIARVMSQSLARIADAEVGAIRDWVGANIGDDEDALVAVRKIAPQIVESLETFLLHVWRRQVSSAIRRQGLLGSEVPEQTVTVGFADLVRFTQLSRHLDEPGLTNVVERLESRSQELIAEHGGRIVKSIGDEVMFAADDPAVAANIGLLLIEASVEDDDLPELRVGLAHGPVVPHRGDLYGATVNLASRIVGIARPSSVLVSAEVKDALQDHEGFELKPIPARRLKGIGVTRIWVARRATSGA